MSKSKPILTAGEPWSDAEVRVLLSIWGDPRRTRQRCSKQSDL